MIWLINMNSNACHIYNYQKNPAQLTLIKELSDPAARHKASEELTSDRPGLMAHGTYSPHTDPKENEIDHFAREVAKELTHGKNNRLYKELTLIAPPHMVGLMNQHLDKQVKKSLTHCIQNDLIHLKTHELLAFVINASKR